MTTQNNALLAEAQAAGEGDGNDQSVVQKGGVRELPPEGPTPARLVSYVETGSHMAYHKGVATKNKEMVRGKFELLGKKHRNEYTDEDGNTKVFYNTIEFGMGKFKELPLSSNEKAGYYKLLKKMIANQTGIRHMGDMLDQGFLLDIVHTESEGKKYANMKRDGEWTIRAPFVEQTGDDGELVQVAYPVPPSNEPLQFMKLSKATELQWDSLFIDGEYERTIKEEGKPDVTETVSRNFLQNRIREGANFEGSILQEALGGIDAIVIKTPTEKAKTEAPVTLDEEPPKEEAKPATKKAAKVESENPADGVVDPVSAANELLNSLDL